MLSISPYNLIQIAFLLSSLLSSPFLQMIFSMDLFKFRISMNFTVSRSLFSWSYFPLYSSNHEPFFSVTELLYIWPILQKILAQQYLGSLWNSKLTIQLHICGDRTTMKLHRLFCRENFELGKVKLRCYPTFQEGRVFSPPFMRELKVLKYMCFCII